MEQDYLTIEQTAELLSLSSRTIHRYIRKGLISATKIGSEWRIRRADIENLMNSTPIAAAMRRGCNNDVEAFAEGRNARVKGRFRCCVIVDCDFRDYEEAEEVSKALISMMNRPNDLRTDASCQYSFNSDSGKGRFTLFGNPAFLGVLLGVLGEYEGK